MSNETKHLGYKKCRYNQLVVLEIIGDHNENRKNIIDKRFAMMRCSKARVLDIYDMYNESRKSDKAYGLRSGNFKYEIGKIVESESFDPDLEEVRSSGIHYFLTRDVAFFWNYMPSNGPYNQWYDNGQMKRNCTYINWLMNDPFETWYESGQIAERCIFEDGKRMVYMNHGMKTAKLRKDSFSF